MQGPHSDISSGTVIQVTFSAGCKSIYVFSEYNAACLQSGAICRDGGFSQTLNANSGWSVISASTMTWNSDSSLTSPTHTMSMWATNLSGSSITLPTLTTYETAMGIVVSDVALPGNAKSFLLLGQVY